MLYFTKQGIYGVFLPRNCMWKEGMFYNQIKVEGARDEIVVDYGSGSRCSTRIQLAAASLFPWQQNQ